MLVRLLVEVNMLSVSPIMDWKKKTQYSLILPRFLFTEVLTQ